MANINALDSAGLTQLWGIIKSTFIASASIDDNGVLWITDGLGNDLEVGQTSSIDTATINSDGHLIITLKDGTPIDAGYARGEQGIQGETGEKGEDGATGNGIASATISDGYLTLHYTDGTDSDAFYVRGDQGAQGEQGIQGEQGEKGETGATGPAYTLTDDDKTAIVDAVLAELTRAEDVTF